MDDPRVGSVLDGRYRIDARLAAGGTGIVYYATQLGLFRSVAIKFLHQSAAQSAVHQGRFEREARVMSKLGHPNIAAILDFGSDGDAPYLVMELCNGMPLRDVISQGPVQPRRAIHIARQILAGLAHAHAHNIVHRDLKPGNLLLLDTLGEDQIKILDFGVAKIMSADGPTELSVAASGPLGTPHYMSPEQAKVEAVDSRTDLYSLGIILYEMTTGKRPFDSGAGFALLRQHVEDSPQPPRALCAISEELQNVILRAMEKHPDDRFQTAAEMMDALAQVPEVTGSPASRGRGALWSGIAVLSVASLLAGAWYGAQKGWYEPPWLGSQTSHPVALAPLDAAPAISIEADRGDATRASAARESATRTPSGELLPVWSPPSATIELGVDSSFPDLENQSLLGKVAGQSFEPRFAMLMVDGESARLRFASNAAEQRACATVEKAELGTEISMALPTRPVEGETLRSDRHSEVTVLTGPTKSVRKAHWKLQFTRLDANSGTAAGSVELRGRRTRLSGDFVAAYCPDLGAGNAVLPMVNGVVWNPDRAPEPESLPDQAVAGAFGDAEFVPAQVHLTNVGSGARTTLSFFAEAPLEPCSELGASDVGAIVSLPGPALGEYAFSTILQDESVDSDATPWGAFQFGDACAAPQGQCIEPRHVEAGMLSIQIDAIFAGEIRGRIYVAAADSRRSLLVGAFRALDCRSRMLRPKIPDAHDDAGPIDDPGARSDSP